MTVRGCNARVMRYTSDFISLWPKSEMTQDVSSSTSMLAACARVIHFTRRSVNDLYSYLEITVQHTLLVKVRHTLRDLVYHFQYVNICGISVAQPFQVFD